LDFATPSFVFALALLVGVAGQVVARHLRVPAIIVLLGFGVALGPDGLGWIRPAALGPGLLTVVSLAVSVILFEGGLGLDLRALRRAALPLRRLVTLGALVTTLGAGVAAAGLLGLPWPQAILYGTLVIVTGPTVIRPVLRFAPVRARLTTLLEGESLLIDPVGAIAAAVALEVVLSGTLQSAAVGAAGLVARLTFGAGAGVALGFALAFLVRVRRLVPEGLENLVVLGGALAGFATCEAILSESGILAVIVAGAVVAHAAPERVRHVGEFQELLTVALIGLLFVLLAADVRLADVVALGWPGVGVVATLVFVVRPLGVWLSLRGSEFAPQERWFVAWLGPRGVVAAAFASIVASSLDTHGVAGGSQLRALVFLTIALTVVVLGGGAPLVSRLLGVRAAGREGTLILGAERLGLVLGERLRSADERVTFADNNPEHCRAAERAGFSVVFGDALDPNVRGRMRLERARIVIALTSSGELNQLFAAEAAREHGVREAYVAASRDTSGASTRLASHHNSRVLFDRPKDIARWNVRLRHGAAVEKRIRFLASSERAPALVRSGDADAYLIAAVRSGKRWVPMHADYAPKPGDEGLALIHGSEASEAEAALAVLGWAIEAAPDDLDQAAAAGV
jgi:NhaP-type Na+/H+ or K+/H+ antiporter